MFTSLTKKKCALQIGSTASSTQQCEALDRIMNVSDRGQHKHNQHANPPKKSVWATSAPYGISS